MAFLKRAFFSMKHSWLKNLFVIIMFTVLFACCVGFLVVYATSSKQLATVRKNTAYTVTIRASYYLFRGINRGAQMDLSQVDIDRFIDDSSVSGYNVVNYFYISFIDIEPLYIEERDDYPGAPALYDAPLYAPIDSSRDKAFTVYGYNLVEGRHFTAADVEEKVCLISRELAQHNNLTIGSTFSIAGTNPTSGEMSTTSVPVTVIGIFDTAESIYQKGHAAREEEIVFSPRNLIYSLRPEKDPQKGSPAFAATVFLKNAGEIPGFLERTKEKFDILEVRDSHFDHRIYEPVPEKCAGMAFESFLEYIERNPSYYLQLNQEWYDMTMGPTEKMNQLAGGMTLAFLAASALVLVLVNALLLKNKRREFGMLCAMGESKGKVALQAAIEILVPIFIAVLLGLAVGVAVGIPLAEDLTASVYEQNAADVQGVNDMVTYAHTQQNIVSQDMFLGTAMTDLLSDELPAVVVPPQPKAQVDGAAVGAYFCAVLALALAAVLIQAGAVLRLKPAKILTGKG